MIFRFWYSDIQISIFWYSYLLKIYILLNSDIQILNFIRYTFFKRYSDILIFKICNKIRSIQHKRPYLWVGHIFHSIGHGVPQIRIWRIQIKLQSKTRVLLWIFTSSHAFKLHEVLTNASTAKGTHCSTWDNVFIFCSFISLRGFWNRIGVSDGVLNIWLDLWVLYWIQVY